MNPKTRILYVVQKGRKVRLSIYWTDIVCVGESRPEETTCILRTQLTMANFIKHFYDPTQPFDIQCLEYLLTACTSWYCLGQTNYIWQREVDYKLGSPGHGEDGLRWTSHWEWGSWESQGQWRWWASTIYSSLKTTCTPWMPLYQSLLWSKPFDIQCWLPLP